MLSNLLADVNQFLPTPSHGGRPNGSIISFCARPYFYPRPHMEGDSAGPSCCAALSNFYPRPHMEGDRLLQPGRPRTSDFYPRPHMEGDF